MNDENHQKKMDAIRELMEKRIQKIEADGKSDEFLKLLAEHGLENIGNIWVAKYPEYKDLF